MNKTELINAVAEKANLSKAQAKAALDATLNTISEALLKEDKVALIGFGTFSVAEKACPYRHQPPHKGEDRDSRTQGREVQGRC